MTEDDLLYGVTGALTAGGWMWCHIRRSDRALVMGDRGWPDIVAAKGGHLLVLELKAAGGVVAPEQWAWISRLHHAGVDARVIRPDEYDALVAELVGERLLRPLARLAKTPPPPL